MTNIISKSKTFNTQKSTLKSDKFYKEKHISSLKNRTWSNNMERVVVIREGIPYDSIEIISERLGRPIKSILSIVGMPQTTYNKKKAEHSLMSTRDTELIILISEMIDFGLEVFNNEEEKFQRWLKKPNISLGGNTPESLLDTTTGIVEVNACLNRIEYGIFV